MTDTYFNLFDLDVRSQDMDITFLVNRVNDGLLKLDEPDAKSEETWTHEYKSLFIESLMMGNRMHLTSLYLDGSEDVWKVIDGTQRIRTVIEFLNNEFNLIKVNYIEKVNNLYYRDFEFKYTLTNTWKINASIISSGTPLDIRKNLLKRINRRKYDNLILNKKEYL